MISKNVSLELQEIIEQHKTILINDVKKGKRISLTWNGKDYTLIESNLSGIGKSKVSRVSIEELKKCIEMQEIKSTQEIRVPKVEDKRISKYEEIKIRNIKIVEEFKSGINVNILSKKYKLTANTLTNILYQNKCDKIKGSYKSKQEKKGFEKNKKRDAEIKSLYENGINVKVLSRKYDVQPSTIYQLMKKLEV